ncbi:uncharacterized protein LOC131215374 [Anopheles bellator]|uniref:uncharacterized protein LOC131215374 n=1 Tax=Anopheles bellator TaxID=139047 RepID=UPI0026479EA1|nr:uncharacterized protein LOC131215374 [Anopheles bellator]
MASLSCWRILTRRKVLSYDGGPEKLGRILNTFDLTALGVGATLGVGVYVLAGHVSKDQAGPSVVLSFLIAAAASFLAGLCYAEFGARVPKSGSAYIYSYVCIGEFMAFIIGWNLMLEYIIGSASVSRGLSLYIDTLANDTMKLRFREVAPIEWDFMSEYFDFFAFSVAILLGVALAFGLKKSTMVNNAFTVLNIFIVLFVIVAGAINADVDNWRIDPATVPNIYAPGDGGFFPFGFEGTLRGAATCFFGFVGFDCIATTGEEVRNPRKAIPRAILFSLCTIFLAYFGVSTVLTLMWPYYKQDVNAPLPHVFNEIGWHFAKWIVAIGGIIGLVASLFGAMFPQPRIIYAMAQDGLIFRFLGEVSPRFKTPVIGTLCAASLTGTLGGLFDLKALVNMLSIGTLMAYTVVAISILILRFSENPDPAIPSTSRDVYESSNLLKARERVTGSVFCKQLLNLSCVRLPTNVSARVVGVLVTVYCLLSIALALTIYYAQDALYEAEAWAWTLFGILLACTLLVLLLISIQPREQADAPFRVPLVPLLPGISIFVNIYLMLMLDVYTWIRFGIWMAFGLAIYLMCVCVNNTRDAKNVDVRVPTIEVIPSDQEGSMETGSIDADRRAIGAAPTEHYQSQNGFYSQNLNTAVRSVAEVATGRDAGLLPVLAQPKESAALALAPIAALAVVPELEEDQKQTKASGTPPKSTFDEIIPLSELAEGFTEKVEPNGKVYFVAHQQQQPGAEAPEPSSLSEEKETSRAIAFLDNILNDEDTVPSGEEPLSSGDYSGGGGIGQRGTGNPGTLDDDAASLASPVFRERSVVADIHRANDVEVPIDVPVPKPTPEEQSEQASDDTKLEARIPPIKIIPVESAPVPDPATKLKPRAIYVDKGGEAGGTPKVLTEDEQEFINFRAVEKERFMTHLSTLLVNPQKPILKRPEDDPSTPTVVALNRSSSEPSFVLLLNKLNGSDSPQESETDEPEEKVRPEPKSMGAIPPAPKFDATLFNTIRAGGLPVDLAPRSPIPQAPKFDPVLYNTATLGKGKAQRASILPPADEVAPKSKAVPPPSVGVGQYYELELKKLKPIAVVPVVGKVNETSRTVDDPREEFKSRLSRILQRGPLEAPGRPKTLAPNSVGAVSADNIAPTSPAQKASALPAASSTDSGLGLSSSSLAMVSTVAAEATKPPATVKRDESFRDRARGFDTAKMKQKLLFDDVLKSINPETRPSSIRNSAENRVSFRHFKEGLRKTVPPKQFLPSA